MMLKEEEEEEEEEKKKTTAKANEKIVNGFINQIGYSQQ